MAMANAEPDVVLTTYPSWSDRMAATPDMDLPTLRNLFEEWHIPAAEPSGVGYEEADAGGLPVLWCLPEGAAADRVLVFSNAGTDALVSRALLEGMSGMYLGAGGNPAHPLANPLYADLTGLPPTYLCAGGHETLLDDAERFHELARAAGADSTIEMVPGMQHVFTCGAGRMPEADAALTPMAA
jgi:acetyl esterase/lipase